MPNHNIDNEKSTNENRYIDVPLSHIFHIYTLHFVIEHSSNTQFLLFFLFREIRTARSKYIYRIIYKGYFCPFDGGQTNTPLTLIRLCIYAYEQSAHIHHFSFHSLASVSKCVCCRINNTVHSFGMN